MKFLFSLLFLILITISCIPQKEVFTDYSYEGDFRNYKTYAFVNNYYEEGEINHNLIPVFEKFITQNLQAQGYEYSKVSPDLLVNYKFYNDHLNLSAANQPRLAQWLKRCNDEEPGEDNYNLHAQKLKKGAVLISIFDNHNRVHIWQGYSSGKLQNNGYPDLKYLRASVSQIFSEYRILARGYMASAR